VLIGEVRARVGLCLVLRRPTHPRGGEGGRGSGGRNSQAVDGHGLEGDSGEGVRREQEHGGVCASQTGGDGRGGSGGHVIPEVFLVAAWIVGKYSHLIPEVLAIKDSRGGLDPPPQYDDRSAGPYHSLVQLMTSPTNAAGINPLPMPT
jgi:hypothetical protein